MKKLAILFATFVCLAMISGSFAASSQATNKVMPTIQDHKLVVVVPVNPSTGYHWRLSYDPTVKLISHQYIPDVNPFHYVGVGGHDIYKFSGQPGQKIVLELVSPGGKVTETRTYYIK